MNKILIGVVSVLVLGVGFLLLEGDDVTKISTTDTQPQKNESKTSTSSSDVKIDYQVSKATPKPKKSETPSEPVSQDKVQKVVNEHRLLPTKSSKDGEDIIIKDSSGRYEANVMVDTSSYRDEKMFPQIPVMATFKMPSGEVIKAQIDPSLSSGKSYLKVKDTQSGEESIYDVSQLSQFKSSQDATIELYSDGSSNTVASSQSSSKSILPPMPPAN